MIQNHVPRELIPQVRRELGIFLRLFEKMTDEELADVHNGLYHVIQQLQDSNERKQSPTKSGVTIYEGMKVQLAFAVIEGRDQFDKSMLLGDSSVREIE